MKKDKKFNKATPVIETVDDFKPGTVGEFIALLSEFPKDGKFELDGKVNIKDIFDGGASDHSVVIYPRTDATPANGEIGISKEEDIPVNPDPDDYMECATPIKRNDVVTDNYYYGCVDPDSGTPIAGLRRRVSDSLMEINICRPNTITRAWEKEVFSQEQLNTIEEIRCNNAIMAENMAEIYRRQISAILEYSLQANLQFAKKTMCTLCDHKEF